MAWKKKFKKKFKKTWKKSRSLYKKLKRMIPALVEKRSERKKVFFPVFTQPEAPIDINPGSYAIGYAFPTTTQGTDSFNRIGNKIRAHSIVNDFRYYYKTLASDNDTSPRAIIHEIWNVKGQVGLEGATTYNNVVAMMGDADVLTLFQNIKPLIDSNRCGFWVKKSVPLDVINYTSGNILLKDQHKNLQFKKFKIFSKKGMTMTYDSSSATRPDNRAVLYVIVNASPHIMTLVQSQFMSFHDY